MTSRSIKILIGVLVPVVLGVVGFFVLVGIGIASLLDGTEYDFIGTTSPTAECFRLDVDTFVVQIGVGGNGKHDLEIDQASLADPDGVTLSSVGLVSGFDPPLSGQEPPTRDLVATFSRPWDGNLGLTAPSGTPAFLLLAVTAVSGTGTATGVDLEYVPGEPLYVDAISFDLEISNSQCRVTNVSG